MCKRAPRHGRTVQVGQLMALLMTCNLVKEDFVAELVEAGLDEKCVGRRCAAHADACFVGALSCCASRDARARAV
jgi:hypothetical protein